MTNTATKSLQFKFPTWLAFSLGLYGFILALSGFKDAWSLAFSNDSSGSFVQTVLDASLATPYTSLLSGIIITSLVQSSSATIALVVATVASGVIGLEQSVFILMGANIGTTITNTIVALAHSHRKDDFQRVLPSVLVDDIFKVLNVTIFFVIEISTGMLHHLSTTFVSFLESSTPMGGFLNLFPDLVDVVTRPPLDMLIYLVTHLPFSSGIHALLVGLTFFLLLIACLGLMGETLEHWLEDKNKQWVTQAVSGKLVSFSIGFVLCWFLQSSSVTVSLVLPLVSQGVMNLSTVYRYSIGAALATTCDPSQLLSYLKFGPVGLSAGMVHILLNIFGAIIFLFVPGISRLPIIIAEAIGTMMTRHRHAPLVLLGYVGMMFFGLPLSVIFAMKAWAG